MSDCNLGVGPMSPEVVEAIFKYSHYHRTPLMIIASKNQIDYKGGYVNGWDTKAYMEFVNQMKATYSDSQVTICRDHCGPGFNGDFDLKDTYSTIEEDIKQGFDLIHIDFCHFKGSKDEQFEESKKVIEFCQKLNPNVLLEVGTDENEGVNFDLPVLAELEREIDFFSGFCKPAYYVVQTGSLVKEINQVGNFNVEFTKKNAEVLHSKGIKLKEHNADYLTKDEILERKGIVDALNIAPQMGVVQAQYVLGKCLVYGIDYNEFLEEVYNGKKWEKWLHTNTPENKFLCFHIAGHYHFNSDAYKRIIEKLAKHEDVHENIINIMIEIINHYQFD